MKNLVAAVAAFFCIALAAPASAGIITYTYTGTLTQHIASSPDAVIEGLGPFAVGSTATLTFMHDTSKGSDFPSPTQLANIGTDNLAFSFSINGNTYAGPTGFASVSGAVFIDANAGQSDIVNRLSFSNPPLGAPTGTLYQAYDVAAEVFGPPGTFPLTFDQSFNIIPSGGVGGDFFFSATTYSCAIACDGASFKGTDRLEFILTSVSAVTQTVPEPLTFSVFSAGLVGAFAARRRKNAARLGSLA
jgi:hypothetical protein